MAKLGVYYGLCPLIDHRSILGISPDCENGVVIVTLGKNIAIKFKLLGQKQLYSWRTKEKFSSPIIYDFEVNSYVAVFNQSYIRMWNGDEENIDKLKKLKFQQQIFTIFTCNNKNYMVFTNGAIQPLHEAIEQRKDLVLQNFIDSETEYINDLLYINLNEDLYVALLIKNQISTYLLWSKFKSGEKPEQFSKIVLQRDKECELNGYVLHQDKMSAYFLSLWEDGRVYCTKLTDNDQDSSNIGELFAVIESVSCKYYISMLSLDDNYIAMYGGNCNEEGALLSIYNFQFKVTQTKQEFKLFTKGARLWRIDNNLYLSVGQNLAVVPFNLDTEQLAALVGSHKISEIDSEDDVTIIEKLQIGDWGDSETINPNVQMPYFIQTKVQEFIVQGMPEREILQQILPKFLEDKNCEAVRQCLICFIDIPEEFLVKILKSFLNFNPTKRNNDDRNSLPEILKSTEKQNLINLVLIQNFNDSLMLPYLRYELDLNEVLCILKYIHYLLFNDEYILPSLSFIDSQSRLMSWICVLLDANYQKILLSKDSTIVEILDSLSSHVNEELDCVNELQDVACVLRQFKKGKLMLKSGNITKLGYSIEQVNLY